MPPARDADVVPLKPSASGAGFHHVVTLLGPSVSLFEAAVPCEVFGIWRPEVDGWNYRHTVASSALFAEAGQGGLRLQAGAGLEAVPSADTVIVTPPVGAGTAPSSDQFGPLVEALAQAHARGARMVSLCTGAYLLAEAGLLDGRRATTHWMHTSDFQHRFPEVTVDPRVLWVQDGNVFTSAGTAAAIDLCLHLVRSDLGAEAATRVARRMVVPPHRDGGQAQFITAPVPDCPDDDPLGDVLAWMVEHLGEQLSVAQLARRANLSPRTFARRFAEATGTTPLQWLLAQRVTHARRLLEATDLPVEQVAHQCGFSTAAALRVHFQRLVGAPPQAYRRTFREDRAS